MVRAMICVMRVAKARCHIVRLMAVRIVIMASGETVHKAVTYDNLDHLLATSSK